MNLHVLAILALFAAAQDKTYDLRLEAKPVKGHKSDLTEASIMKMTMKMTGLPEPMAMGEENNYVAGEEVLSADADGNSELRRQERGARVPGKVRAREAGEREAPGVFL
jgi:hypothetical protein